MDQTTLIALLNDIAADDPVLTSSGVYFNADGQPTDRFLEALKHDLGKFPDFSDYQNNQLQNEQHRYGTITQLAQNVKAKSSKSSPRIISTATITQRKSSSPSHTKTQATNKKSIQMERDYVLYHVDRPEVDFSSSSVSSREDNVGATSILPRKDETDNFAMLHEVRISKGKKKLGIKTTGNDNSKCKTEPLSTASTKMKKSKNNSDSHAPTIPSYQLPIRHRLNTSPPVIDPDELDDELIEKEGKIKSLQLRLCGQLQTIKELENQLAEAHVVIESKTNQITKLSSKLRSVGELQLRHDQAQRVIEESKVAIDSVDQLKVRQKIIMFLIWFQFIC
jgi:uncharacterized coiled-coil protein SlyX